METNEMAMEHLEAIRHLLGTKTLEETLKAIKAVAKEMEQ